MIDKDIWLLVEGLQADHRSGAAEIAARIPSIFRAYLDSTVPTDRCYNDLRQLADSIAEAQPSMAPVANVANLCAEALKTSSWRGYREALDGVDVNLRQATAKVVEAALPLVPNAARVLTLSYSSNVAAVLRGAARDGRVAEVTVLESRPGMEGRRLARDLVQEGLPTRLAVDALGPSLVGQADLVLVGADALLRTGGIINKIGTLGVAALARAQKVPVVVASELTKLDARTKASEIPVDVERESTEVLDPPVVGIHVLNVYFEVVPPEYIHRIATDRGALTPAALAKLASSPKGLLEAYLGLGRA